MLFSSLQKAKLRKLFDLYDHDRNGFVEKKDFDKVVMALAQARSLAPDSPQYEQLESSFLKVWRGLRNQADRNRDERISFEEMVTYSLDVMANPERFRSEVLDLGGLLFDLLDADLDGQISLEEYQEFGRCLGFEARPQTFARLGDGQSLSRPKMLERLREFYFSHDETVAGNELFGSLFQRV